MENEIEKIINYLEKAARSYGFDEQFKEFRYRHDNFKIRVPFVGAFSVGKSRLINTLIGEKLLGVEVDPETCLPTELFYSQEETIEIVTSKGDRKRIARETLKDKELLERLIIEIKKDNKEDVSLWIEAGLPNSLLRQHQELVFVDIPGWGSGNSDHDIAIDNYIEKTAAYILVVSAKEGTLRESIESALKEINSYRKPIVLVINKIDSIDEREREAVKSNLSEQVRNRLDHQPIDTLCVSAVKKQIAGLDEAIVGIASQSDKIYMNMVGDVALQLCDDIIRYVSVLENKENLTIDKIKSQLEEIPAEINNIEKDIENTIDKVNGFIPVCVEQANTCLENELKAKLDTLASHALNGSDITPIIKNALRTSYLTTVENDFKPRVRQDLASLHKADDFLSTNISASPFINSENDSNNYDDLSEVIVTVVEKVMKSITKLEKFSIYARPLIALFTAFVNKQESRQHKLENARSEILSNVIPQVIDQARTNFKTSFESLMTKIEGEMKEDLRLRSEDKKRALNELKLKLDQEQEIVRKEKEQYAIDISKVNQIREALTKGKEYGCYR